MRTLLAALALAAAVGVSTARAADKPSLSVGLRLQGWYVAEQHGAADGGTAQDFLLRRGYLSLAGKLNSTVSAFVHVAGDRISMAVPRESSCRTATTRRFPAPASTTCFAATTSS
jgi:hypothetical protein